MQCSGSLPKSTQTKHMRILIDIGHPAHVHLFKYFAGNLMQKGWSVLFSVREKGENVKLLSAYGLPYVIYGKHAHNKMAKVATLARKNLALVRVFKSFKPLITISHSSFYLSQVSWYFRIPNITLEDTGNMEQVMLYLPFTDSVLTPQSYHRDHGKKHIRYNGLHECAYLHPDFQNPNNSIEIEHRSVLLIRLVDWTASHDIGHKGLAPALLDQLLMLGKMMQCKVKVLSEKPLPIDLQPYALDIRPHELHSYLSSVKLCIGEGATLASECALMGVPAIYVNSRPAGVIEEHAKAGLLYHFKTSDGVLPKAKEILNNPVAQDQHRLKAERYLKTKINLTRFLVWLVENWPESRKIMKEDPGYQLRFK